MANYKLSEKAQIKLAQIYEYSLRNFGERHADAYYTSLHEVFGLLAQMPTMGRSWLRWRRHEHNEHVILYTLTSGGVRIVQRFHHSENIVAKMKS